MLSVDVDNQVGSLSENTSLVKHHAIYCFETLFAGRFRPGRRECVESLTDRIDKGSNAMYHYIVSQYRLAILCSTGSSS